MVRWIAHHYLESFRGLSPQVWLVSLTILINRSGTMVLPFFALYAIQELGLSVTTAGRLMAVYGMGAILGNWLGGWLTGKFGPFLVQFASLVLGAVGFVVLSLAQTGAALAVCVFLLSLVSEGFRPASATATTLIAPPAMHSRAFALNRLAVNLGMSIGPVLGGFLAEIGFRFLFYVDAATCLLAAVFVASALGLRPLPEHESTEPPPATSARSPWRDRPFLLVMFVMFLMGLVFFQLLGTFVIYLEQHYRFSKPLIGGMLAINTVLIVLFEMLVIRHTEHYSRLLMMAHGCIFLGLGFGLLPFGTSIGYCGLMIVLWTIGEILNSAPSLAYVTSRSTRANRASYLAFYTMTMSASLVLAPWLGMRIYAVNPDWVWYASLVVCLSLAAAIYVIDGRWQIVAKSAAEVVAVPAALHDLQYGDVGGPAEAVAEELSTGT